MRLSLTEENYIKAIYHLSQKNNKGASTNAIAKQLNTKAASVSDMLKKLAKKELLNHQKYHGVQLTSEGIKVALWIVRKHRLWEVFLVEKLNFNWDEVHQIAEQLEHINSVLLIERLDEFLGKPKYDPHGEPIPDKNGLFTLRAKCSLIDLNLGQEAEVIAVQDDESLLQYLDKVGIKIGTKIKVLDRISYDNSLELLINDKVKRLVSSQIAKNILLSKDDL
jgi:DtxR family Mn-dependent transcriptional regulator